MNVSANKLARRLAAVLVSLFAVVVLALPAAAAPQVDKTTPVNDYAGILSQDTIAYVTEISSALQSTCGAEIGVYTTEYIGNSTMEGYAYSVLNEWGLGSSDRDNGVLLLLAPGEDDYYITRGTGLNRPCPSAPWARSWTIRWNPTGSAAITMPACALPWPRLRISCVASMV